MKKSPCCLFVLIVLVLLGLCGIAFAAPSLPVTKPPVVPLMQYTGPMLDPFATNGQWFITVDMSEESFRTHEFYDNYHASEWASVHAISGYVDSITYLAGPGTPITAFSIAATIHNDTATYHMDWSFGDNSHGETNFYMEEAYVGEMVDTKLTADFAIADLMYLPTNWIPPYMDYQPYIVAENEDQLAWYCWSPEDPDPEHRSQIGSYWVPTWDFGTIPIGSSSMRQLQFAVPATLNPMDPRYPIIEDSFATGKDVLLNRSTSLKISTWIDDLYYDDGTSYPLPPARSSDVSVFHNKEEEETTLDYGDAPDPTYPTLLASDGARHIVFPGVFMGLLIDAELDGQPDATATGDDNANLADEDGVVFLNSLVAGQTATVQVTVSTSGYISAWIDYGIDGSWNELGDQILTTAPVSGPGTYQFPITVPPGLTQGTSFSRFRFTTQQTTLYPTGFVADGEVEDYVVEIYEEQLPYEFGDAPEGALAYPSLSVTGQFPTCTSVGPALWIQHTLGNSYFGPSWDSEFDGNAGFCPAFNPNTYNQDECFNDPDAGLMTPDGYTITGPLGSETVQPCSGGARTALGYPCQMLTWGLDVDIWVTTMASPAYVNVLMDWNQDGIWAGSTICPGGAGPVPEHVLVNFLVPAGFNGPLSTLTPAPFQAGPNSGYVWTRFTLSDIPVTTPWTGDGMFDDGETEDYLLRMYDLDFGDAMDSMSFYPTLLANNGARHVIVSPFHLGALVDAEPDGQPTLNADGDDVNPPAGLDDEDGVTLPAKFYAGDLATVTVNAATSGWLNAWIDWNSNGSWAEAGEQVATNHPLVPGPNVLNIPVPQPPAFIAGGPHSRWRFTSYAPAVPTYTGMEMDGEVEDYEVFLDILDFGDAPAPYPTLLADNGAQHRVAILPVYYLGAMPPDNEPDGLPDANATGDDLNNTADEDGVSLAGQPFVLGNGMTLNVIASTDSFLNAWIDFNRDGDWTDAGEQIATGQPLLPAANAVNFTVPIGGSPGITYGRFRLSSASLLSSTGFAFDGEVEDHQFTIYQNGPSDPTNLVITNILTVSTNEKQLWWVAETDVVYEVQYTPDLVNPAPVPWTSFGGYVVGPADTQIDSNSTDLLRGYRVTAPYSPPPP